MPAKPLFAHQIDAVKKELHAIVTGLVDAVVDRVFTSPLRPDEVERNVWATIIAVGRALMSALLGVLCFRRTMRRLQYDGLSLHDVYLRTDEYGIGTSECTLGSVPFAWFAYRELRGGETKRPAAALFPMYEHGRSSRMRLEWECALGSEHPFRSAEQAIRFFTHGAVTVSDSTIERHAVAVGRTLTEQWLYRPRSEIIELLSGRATIDALTQRPLVYTSTDAHLLKRYVDDTWTPEWKAINGIRVWCIDRRTGEIIHLGGEFTWGDCGEVAERFVELRRRGILPHDGDYGDGVRAQLVLVTDGPRWIEDRIYPLFPDAVVVLDAYHLVERFGAVAAAVYGAGTPRAEDFKAELSIAMGLRDRRPREPKKRRGHRKQRREPRVLAPVRPPSSADLVSRPQHIDRTVNAVTHAFRHRKRLPDAASALVTFLDDNAYRLDFTALRARGIQIGSGAMESMHRFGSQLRTKRSGCKWLADTVLGILNLRMLARVERWDEFWSQRDLDDQLAVRLAA